ncbi:MAG TPA: undecaprenyl-diphosphate phosphatase [Opitutaceae bacterium]|nr:undecaprenyl-diphosphate phosphatase [Opitutaceae bacterium]
MSPTILQIILLGLIQGAAELLPVSSSAHVIVAEKLMRLDPADPVMSFLLVMLHTGTMFAVIAYFWRAWRKRFFASAAQFRAMVPPVVLASAGTVAVYLALKELLEKVILAGRGRGEIEQLFSNLPLIAAALLAVGVLILWSARAASRRAAGGEVTLRAAVVIGLVQGFCVPFRGFSRSGATISAGLLAGVGRWPAEVFSFALAVILTPPAIAQEFLRLRAARAAAPGAPPLLHLLQPGLIGMGASFVAGLLGLAWLSRWLETGRWQLFGYYCLAAAAVIFVLAAAGF